MQHLCTLLYTMRLRSLAKIKKFTITFNTMKGQKCGWMSFAIFVYKSIYTTNTKSLQSCPTLCDPIDGSPPGSPVPGILQARTRVGYHFLLQCVKVKSESEVAQSCPTLSNPMDCSPTGSSSHGIFQARILEWGAIAFSVLGAKDTAKVKSSMGNQLRCSRSSRKTKVGEW